MSIGLGPIAPHYALLNLELPTVALAALAGLLIGRVAPGRWLALSLAFAAGMSVIGQTFQTWRSFAVGYMLPARILATVMGIGALAAFLPTLSMAWLFSRTARISHAWKAAGRCGECGYDLRATTAPRCPECGAANGPGTRFGLGQPNATERFDENGLRRP